MDTPQFLREFIDDAAIFPPGNAPLDEAIDAHQQHRDSEYAALVGGFVVSDGRLPELCELISDPIAINLVVTGGAGAIAGAVTWAERAEGVSLRAVEFALRDEEDLVHNAGRVIAACDDAGVDCPVYVEPPRVVGEPSHGWLAALDALAAREFPVKFRLGGASADMVPTGAELAAGIHGALDREIAFKCTAGLHRAVRHGGELGRDEDAGHGFLNVLAATRADLDGASPEEVVAVLEEREGRTLLERFDPDALARTRRWFHSFGSCSILEPHDDLVDLELM